MTPSSRPAADLGPLVALVERLRAPDGCPWDREQGLAQLRAYLLEEAHELAAAIDEADWAGIREELGDLLFQAAFVARLGEEAGEFALGAVVAAVHAKFVARHPHVFGDERLADARAVRDAWERRKVAERSAEPRLAGSAEAPPSLLAGVPTSLPALLGAYRSTQKAAGVGFDWPGPAPVLAKIEEELAELRAELAAPETPARSERVREELGDLLFTVANLARHLEIDPEAALAAANRKFRRRFAQVEAALAGAGRTLGEATLEEMEAAWEEAKRRERQDPAGGARTA
jgi:MazG family protein